MSTDNELLEAYAREGSESAFRELVERRINLVYSAALREANGDTGLAEEISQAVFTELATSARKLADHPALSGWLYTTVRRMTANVRRSEFRRQRREQEAFIMNQLLAPDTNNQLWQQVRPVLDDVMHELKDEDRTAVVLRYFEGRSLKEVGTALGVTENAARMRVDRSLEKLQELLSQRGIKSTASTLAAVLATSAILTAPPALAAGIATAAMAGATAGVSAVGMAKVLTLTKIKVAAGLAAAALIVGIGLHPWSKAPNATAYRSASTPQSSNVTADQAASDTSIASNGAATKSPTGSQMLFHLLDSASSQPIAKAKLHLFYLFQDGRGETIKAATDSSGKAAVEQIHRPFRGLNMFIAAEGYVPKVITWGFGRAMPGQYTMKLDRGVQIGGVVVDEAGQPIPGATIIIRDPGNQPQLAENVQFGPNTEAVTDAAGRWSSSMIPKEFQTVGLNVSHPDYAGTTASVVTAAPQASNAVITMKQGFTVAGTVLDAIGNPVAGARVREVRMNEEGEKAQTTDPDGKFQFKHMNQGELVLAVQASGLAPAVQTLPLSTNATDLRFVLGPGQTLRGRVTDEDGQVIANAWAETTRGRRKIQWSATTDANGRFEWDSAPAEPLVYSFQAEGFERAYALELKADGTEHQIKLARENSRKRDIQITGTVIDADTGQPVDDFRVLTGDLEADWAFPLRFAVNGNNGKFSWSLPTGSGHSAYQIQIEKDGYIPAVSRAFSTNEGDQSLSFKLEKGTGPSGIVLMTDGSPAAQAEVYLCTPQAGVSINGPAQIEPGPNTTTYHARTDAEGKFTLPPAVNPTTIIVVHDRGYAEVPVDSASSIALQPWGSIEGTIHFDGKPAANERIVASSNIHRYSADGRNFNLRNCWLETRSDSQGRFSFPKVPPGQATVKRQQQALHSMVLSHVTPVVVGPGSTTQVTLGGSGTPVVGRALLAGADAVDWRSTTASLVLKTGEEPGPRPKPADFSNAAEYVAAAERFFELSRSIPAYGTFCEADGSFRLPDVPPGTYTLRIKALGSKPMNELDPLHPAPELGSIQRDVIVPENGDAANAGPLDLGIIELMSRQSAAR